MEREEEILEALERGAEYWFRESKSVSTEDGRRFALSKYCGLSDAILIIKNPTFRKNYCRGKQDRW